MSIGGVGAVRSGEAAEARRKCCEGVEGAVSVVLDGA